MKVYSAGKVIHQIFLFVLSVALLSGCLTGQGGISLKKKEDTDTGTSSLSGGRSIGFMFMVPTSGSGVHQVFDGMTMDKNDVSGKYKFQIQAHEDVTRMNLWIKDSQNRTQALIPALNSNGQFLSTKSWESQEGQHEITYESFNKNNKVVDQGRMRFLIREETNSGSLTGLAFKEVQSSISEDASLTQIIIEMSEPSDQIVEFKVSTSGTASMGPTGDYNLLSQTIYIGPGETTANLSIILNNDTVTEGNETAIFQIYDVKNADLNQAGASHTLTIIDDDSAPSNDSTVYFALASTNTTEKVETINLEVRLDKAHPSGAIVAVNIDPTSTASVGSDYLFANMNVAFAANETFKVVPIALLDDTAIENPETLILKLLPISNVVVNNQNTHTISIVDNDNAPVAPVAQFKAPQTTTITENTLIVDMVITLDKPATQASSVGLTIDASSTATSGADFNLAANTVNFMTGEIEKTVQLAIVDDAIVENTEQIIINLSQMQQLSIGANNKFTVTINDNDQAPGQSVLSFAEASGTIAEGPGNKVYTTKINFVPAPSENITVKLNLAGTAVINTDYLLPQSEFLVAKDQAELMIPIIIIDDSAVENNETIQLTIQADPKFSLGANPAHQLTITDNDVAGNTPKISFVNTTYTVTEAAGDVFAEVEIQLDQASTETVTVDLLVNANSTADLGADYTQLVNQISLAPGLTSLKVNALKIVNNNVLENDETVILDLANPSKADLTAPTQTIVTIKDDDKPVNLPTLSFAAAASEVDENAGVVNIPIVLSAASTQAITVQVNYQGTAVSGTDYNNSTTIVTFNAGETMKNATLTVIDDTMQEPAETVILNLANPTNANLAAPGAHVLTIKANDEPVPANLVGTLLEVKNGVIYGWAANTANPAQKVRVKFYLMQPQGAGGSIVLGTALANSAGPERMAGIGTNHDFAVVLPNAFHNFDQRKLYAYASTDRLQAGAQEQAIRLQLTLSASQSFDCDDFETYSCDMREYGPEVVDGSGSGKECFIVDGDDHCLEIDVFQHSTKHLLATEEKSAFEPGGRYNYSDFSCSVIGEPKIQGDGTSLKQAVMAAKKLCEEAVGGKNENQ